MFVLLRQGLFCSPDLELVIRPQALKPWMYRPLPGHKVNIFMALHQEKHGLPEHQSVDILPMTVT